MKDIFLSRTDKKYSKRFADVVKQKLLEFNIPGEFKTVGDNYGIADAGITDNINALKQESWLLVSCITKEMKLSSSCLYELYSTIKNKPVICFIETGVETSPIINENTNWIQFNGTKKDLNKHDSKIRSMLDDLTKRYYNINSNHNPTSDVTDDILKSVGIVAIGFFILYIVSNLTKK